MRSGCNRLIVAAASVIGITLGLAPGDAKAQDVTVFAAASLTNALEEIGRLYRASDSSSRVRFSFAASSTLAKQIDAGAPANIFVSADEAWINWLNERRLIDPSSRIDLLTNSLVIVVPASRSLSIDLRTTLDVPALLGTRGRLATGDPAHVPVGRYAQQALTAIGAWRVVESRLAPAENVRAALALVERGETPAGIVYASDAAVAPRVRIAGTFPESTHMPIVYPFALVSKQGTLEARRFFAFMQAEPARGIYRKFGFLVREAGR